jgi:tetratricopeptide (TPR) repeat protein
MRGALDLARDAYQKSLDLLPAEQVPADFRNRLAMLEEQLSNAETRTKALPPAQQSDPVVRAQMAASLGLVGQAIEDLQEADQAGVRTQVARPLLVDLLCQTGQPDRASEFLGNLGDQALNTGPGTAYWRQGLVSLLLGNAASAAELWQRRAIEGVRQAEIGQALATAQALLRGEVLESTRDFLRLPSQLATEATWEFNLGLALLENGQPLTQGENSGAADHFTRALTLSPDLPTRPVIAYYLEKMGQPVPPPSEKEEPAKAEVPKPSEIPLPF